MDVKTSLWALTETLGDHTAGEMTGQPPSYVNV